jgi:hypothetical protein
MYSITKSGLADIPVVPGTTALWLTSGVFRVGDSNDFDLYKARHFTSPLKDKLWHW